MFGRRSFDQEGSRVLDLRETSLDVELANDSKHRVCRFDAPIAPHGVSVDEEAGDTPYLQVRWA